MQTDSGSGPPFILLSRPSPRRTDAAHVQRMQRGGGGGYDCEGMGRRDNFFFYRFVSLSSLSYDPSAPPFTIQLSLVRFRTNEVSDRCQRSYTLRIRLYIPLGRRGKRGRCDRILMASN